MTTGRLGPMVFVLRGDLDVARQNELDEITAAASRGAVAIIDMREVSFLDSTVLDWLVRTKQVVENEKGRLRVVATDGMLARLLSLTGLDVAIDVFHSQHEAWETQQVTG